MNKPIIALVAARAKNGVIGSNGKMPWHIPADLKFFKELTTGFPVIMGRKTYESIGCPLPNRKNIIFSRQKEYSIDGITTVSSIDEALKAAEEYEKIFIIGGRQIYEMFLPIADELWITEIKHVYEGDTYFPYFNTRKFHPSFTYSKSATEMYPALAFKLYLKKDAT